MLRVGAGDRFLLQLHCDLCQVLHRSRRRVELILVVIALVAVLSLVEWVMSDCGTLVN